jgi:hypothetical protein
MQAILHTFHTVIDERLSFRSVELKTKKFGDINVGRWL